ncbi:MAG: bifunctional DNA primase/polymerase [Phycisphaeraceae bacterium]|nr:bifunctional DNA primase/polymerase [Phycisphaeraceae bacterium]
MAGELPTPLEAAAAYTRRGWRVVPIAAGAKGPTLKGWPALRLEERDLASHFHGDSNIGLILGEPSGGLVDVDLDCDEAVELAGRYLPATDAVTGREGRPASHRWYIAEGASTAKHKDADGTMIVELRSTGCQTVVGPSVHPSGGRYDVLGGEPARVPEAMLAACVRALADAVREKRRTIEPMSSAPALTTPHDNAERRAAAYLDAMPPAIAGSGGHNQTYAAATALVHGFALAPDVALHLLATRYNPRCQPPWSERELRHKIDQAASKPHERPRGWLLEAGRGEQGAHVDLSALTTPRQSVHADPGPIPVHLLEVPGFVGDVVRFNLETAKRPQPVLALAGALCLQAVLAGRKVRDALGNRTNLYAVGVADSGSGKDHARKVNKAILFEAGAIELEGNEDLASDAGLFSAVEAQPAVLLQMDEFGRFLRTIGDPKRAPHLYNVLTALMKLYSSADTVYRGKAYADRNRNKVIDQPCVVVYGTTVFEHFYQSLTTESLADGFAARLLVFETDERPARRWAPQCDVPASVVEAARWWHEHVPGGNLAREHPQPRLIETTKEARAIFDALAENVDARMEGAPGSVSAAWARAEEKACRLALLHACSVGREHAVIDAPAARWACELSEHLTLRLLHVAGQWVSEGVFDARQKRVLRVVREMGGSIGRSELCRRTQALTQRERQEVIDNLLETGQLVERAEPTKGRRKVVYALP